MTTTYTRHGEHNFSNGTVTWCGGLDYRRQGEYAVYMPTGYYWTVMQGAKRGSYAARSGYAATWHEAMNDQTAAFQAYTAQDRTEPDPDFRR